MVLKITQNISDRFKGQISTTKEVNIHTFEGEFQNE